MVTGDDDDGVLVLAGSAQGVERLPHQGVGVLQLQEQALLGDRPQPGFAGVAGPEVGAVVGAAVRVEGPGLVGQHEVREPQGGLGGRFDGPEELGEHVRTLLHAFELVREVLVERGLQVELHVLEGVARGVAQQSLTVGRRAVGHQRADDRRRAPGAVGRSTRPRVAQLGDRLDHVEVVGRGQEREEVVRMPGEDRRVRGGGLPDRIAGTAVTVKALDVE